MITTNFHHVVKSSFVYSYAISQSLASYFSIIPAEIDERLLQHEALTVGDAGEVVRLIQLKLNHLGYYDDLIDGKYGLLTEYALREFQSSHNITVTGTTDEQTMRVLINEEKEMFITAIEQLIPIVHYGESSDNVSSLQEKLHYLGYYNGNIDGIYGIQTEKAINDIVYDYFYEEEREDIKQVEQPLNEEAVEVTLEQNKPVKIKPKIEETDPDVVTTARSLIEVPYEWGGTTPEGFDCSGFIQYVFARQNKTIPRTVNDIWNFSTPIHSPSVGDLVFFETYKAGPSHMGIYLGNNEFIHASSSKGVTISHLNETYWDQRYIGAKRIQ